HGRDGFYRGPVAAAIVAAGQKGGGVITLDDMARYEARITEPLSVDFRGYRLLCAPPPASGPVFFLSALKVLESETLGGGPLRTAANLDLLGRIWSIVSPRVWSTVGDAPETRAEVENFLAPDSIATIRARVLAPTPVKKAAWLEDDSFFESAMAATTHWIVADAAGNIVCATQSLSLHFGAGVVPPGTGVVLNDSMSNLTFDSARSPNFASPGRRARSTIAPTIVLRDGKPLIALGIPGASRIPTAMLQVLLDRLVLNRSLADAIGDTRVHFVTSTRDDAVTFEAEESFPEVEAVELRRRGWKVELPEPAGEGQHFGGINAVEFNADGTRTGFADPRRTNAAVGY
ncbi:MAG: gamma-glutamyltransferase, partial [Opitutaceae bacterium]